MPGSTPLKLLSDKKDFERKLKKDAREQKHSADCCNKEKEREVLEKVDKRIQQMRDDEKMESIKRDNRCPATLGCRSISSAAWTALSILKFS
jgi:hypothetical protein